MVGKTCVTLQKAPYRNAKSTISRPDMQICTILQYEMVLIG